MKLKSGVILCLVKDRTRLAEAKHEAVKRAASCVGRDELERKLTDIHHQRHAGLTCLHVTDVKKTSSIRATVRRGAQQESDHIRAGGRRADGQ